MYKISFQGTPIVQVSAQDGDRGSPNNIVYSINSGTPNRFPSWALSNLLFPHVRNKIYPFNGRDSNWYISVDGSLKHTSFIVICRVQWLLLTEWKHRTHKSRIAHWQREHFDQGTLWNNGYVCSGNSLRRRLVHVHVFISKQFNTKTNPPQEYTLKVNTSHYSKVV